MSATATLQCTSEQDESFWGRIKHAADTALQRSGAYLIGQYHFTFHNDTTWTAKLHLTEDAADASQGYFLTLPAGAHGVEVPMRSAWIIVRAGFVHSNAYEVFWPRRRFAWDPNFAIALLPRHSNDANTFHADVAPGAPLATPDRSAPEDFALFERPAVVYSRVKGGWRCASVEASLPGGLLQLEDGVALQPTLQPTLVPCGPAEEGSSDAATPEEEGGSNASSTLPNTVVVLDPPGPEGPAAAHKTL